VLRGRSLTPFDLKVGDAVFNGATLAMEDAEHDRDVSFRVVSCPTGSGKTSASLAFIAAGFGTDPGFTAAYVTDTIAQAEEVRRELALLVGVENVVCWTSEHDAGSDPDSRFDWKWARPAFHPVRSDLAEARIVVATHKAWRGELDRGCGGILQHRRRRRSVVFVDEHPDLVRVIERTPEHVFALRDRVYSVDPEHPLVAALNAIKGRIDGLFLSTGVRFSAPRIVPEDHLDLFSRYAFQDLLRFVRSGLDDEGGVREAEELEATLRFLEAAARGCAFLSRVPPLLIAYEMDRRPGPGHVLLDATADLTGMVALMPGMEVVEAPELDYRNLAIHHVRQPTGDRVGEIVRSAAKARPYAEFVRRTVLENTSPGEAVLAVVHKGLLDHEYLERADDPDRPLDWEGRRVSVIHWGTGIGSNRFKHAEAVFLFSEFHVPRRTSMARVHGWTGRKPTEVEMAQASLRTMPAHYHTASEGHLLRWTKQLACRGNVRNIDAEGRCGAMRLYTSMELARLFANVGRMFPGAPPPVLLGGPGLEGAGHCSSTNALIRLLASATTNTLVSTEVEKLTGIPSRNLKRTCALRHVADAMAVFGWVLVLRRGKGNPSTLERHQILVA
jgi:hypothetical protein